MEEIKTKRKTHTSSAVKNRYNEKNYKNFRAAIKPELYGRIDEYIKQEGISRPEFLLRAIENLKGEQPKHGWLQGLPVKNSDIF